VVVVVPTFTANVEVADPPDEGVTEAGVKVPVTPAGWPESVSETGEANPPVDTTVIPKLPACPPLIVAEEGETDIVKSGVGGGVAAVTVKVTSTL